MNTIYLKLAFRNLLKNRLNTIINILGFSIGIAACFFIFLFINYETGYDKFYPDHNRIFRLIGSFNTKDKSDLSGFTWFPVAPDIANEISGVEAFCRVTDVNSVRCYIDNSVYKIEKFRFADENFFNFFNFKLISGNKNEALDAPDKIVLTERLALKIFGSIDIAGKTIIYQHHLFNISGVAEDPPSNTHLDFNVLAPIKYIEQSSLYYKGWNGGITLLSYLRLAERVSPGLVEKALPEFLDRKINSRWKNTGMSLSISLQNISDVHLSGGSISYDLSSNRDRKSIYIIASICLLIMILAIINYIILYSAQKIAKTKDLGILKIHGAGENALVTQIYFEVLAISVISAIVGIYMLWWSLPFLNTYLQTEIIPDRNIITAIRFLVVVILLLSAIITFFSTKNIFSRKSVEILKVRSISTGSRPFKSNLLITFQYAVVTVLLFFVIVIVRQNNYLQNHELGFDKENIIILESDDEFQDNDLSGFKRDLKQLSEISQVSFTSQTVGKGVTRNGYKIEDLPDQKLLNVIYTDEEFLDCFRIPLLGGRNFSSNREMDKDAILINNELLKFTGWNDPFTRVIERSGKLRIIGVVGDFNFAPLENAVQPLLIMCNPKWDGWGYSTVNIRFQTSDVKALVNKIDRLWKERFRETPYIISFLDKALETNYLELVSQRKIISFFSLLSVFIATIGLFGLNVLTSRNRTKEIGIRKINGATISEVIAMLNVDMIKWVLVSFFLACPVALLVMKKWLINFAYKIEMSWWMFAAAGIMVLTVAFFAIFWQSWRAATRNPVEALRYE